MISHHGSEFLAVANQFHLIFQIEDFDLFWIFGSVGENQSEGVNLFWKLHGTSTTK